MNGRWDSGRSAGFPHGADADAVETDAIQNRRIRAGMPDSVRHREKWRLVLDMLHELAGWHLAPPVMLAGAGYGDNAEFPGGSTARGRAYVVQVNNNMTARRAEAVSEVRPNSGRERRPRSGYRTPTVGLREPVLATGRGAAVELTWRHGSPGPLSWHFVALRVRPAGRRPTARLVADGSLSAATGRMAAGRAHRLWAGHPARGHAAAQAGPAGQNPLADRTRLPRAEERPRPAPLRGPHMGRLVPPRHPGHRRPAVCHPAAEQPKSGCAGLSLYAVLHELPALLATWTGICMVCGHPVDSRARAPT